MSQGVAPKRPTSTPSSHAHASLRTPRTKAGGSSAAQTMVAASSSGPQLKRSPSPRSPRASPRLAATCWGARVRQARVQQVQGQVQGPWPAQPSTRASSSSSRARPPTPPSPAQPSRWACMWSLGGGAVYCSCESAVV